MELKHTPGPWLIASEDKSFVYALGPSGTNKFWAHVQAAGPEKIGKEEKEANARLISSAPDLLSALSCLLAMCVRQHDFNDDGDGKMFERAQAAINKATGAA